MADDLQIIAVTVLSVWTALTSTLRFGEVANSIRDKIITGRSEDSLYSISHRQLMLENDWLPIKSSGALICFGYTAFLLYFSSVIVIGENYTYLIRIAAVFPTIGGCFFLFLGARDYLYMLKILRDARAEIM